MKHVTWTGRCALLPWGAFIYHLAEAMGTGEINLIGIWLEILQATAGALDTCSPFCRLRLRGGWLVEIKPVSSLCFGFLSFTRICFHRMSVKERRSHQNVILGSLATGTVSVD